MNKWRFLSTLCLFVVVVSEICGQSRQDRRNTALERAREKREERRTRNRIWREAGADNPNGRRAAHRLQAFHGRQKHAKDLSEDANVILDFQETLVEDGYVDDVTELSDDTTAQVTVASALEATSCDVLTCDDSAEYRTVDGTCNNLVHPTWGSASAPQRRNVEPVYGDGNSLRSLGSDGNPLPNPRSVSLALHRNPTTDTRIGNRISLNVFQFGQFFDHDFIATPTETGDEGSAIECCNLPEGVEREFCAPINIPSGDPYFTDGTCLNFVRSAAAVPENCALGQPRQQQNQITSYVDASNVYGSSEEELANLRIANSALMATSGNRNNMLPTDSQAFCASTTRECFKAGDKRVNVVPTLAVYHTAWIEEHNRVARALARYFSNPEELFQEARKVVIAQMQKIAYDEFLASFLARETMTKYNLLSSATYNYDDSIDASFSNEGGIAYRMGHSWIPQTITHYNASYVQSSTPQDTSSQYFNPDLAYGRSPNGNPGLAHFLSAVGSPATDAIVEQAASDELFLATNADGSKSSFDLASLNIQRGRDHGVPPYNKMREWCDLPVATRGNYPSHDDRSIRLLDDLYASPDDIDLWTGGLTETPMQGSALGPLFNCILGSDFNKLKFGDRYWYQGDKAGFTAAQLTELDKASMASIFCNNGLQFTVIQPNVMLLPTVQGNGLVPCADIPSIDFTAWDPNNNGGDNGGDNGGRGDGGRGDGDGGRGDGDGGRDDGGRGDGGRGNRGRDRPRTRNVENEKQLLGEIDEMLELEDILERMKDNLD